MGTHDSNQPQGAERPRRRMVLRKIADAAPLLPVAPAKAALAQSTRSARSSAPARSATIRPPVDPDVLPSEAAVPIPLTRLHTPRAAFRSAIDFPTAGTTDEASAHETSSASLPPLVATLPPASPPIYVPAPSSRTTRASRASRSIMVGSLAALAIVATLGGIAMGRRIAQPAAASESQPPIVLVASPAAAPAAVPVTEAPAPAALPDPIMAAPTVEELPKAATEPLRAAPAVAHPIGRPLATPPLPPPAAAPAGHAGPTGPLPLPLPLPLEGAVQTNAKDPSKTEESVAAPAIPASAPPEVDPLVKAVKDDIQEEESRRR